MKNFDEFEKTLTINESSVSNESFEAFKKLFGKDNVSLQARVREYLTKWDDIPLAELVHSMSNDDLYGKMPAKDMKDYCMRIIMNQDTKELDSKYEPLMTKISSSEFKAKMT